MGYYSTTSLFENNYGCTYNSFGGYSGGVNYTVGNTGSAYRFTDDMQNGPNDDPNILGDVPGDQFSYAAYSGARTAQIGDISSAAAPGAGIGTFIGGTKDGTGFVYDVNGSKFFASAKPGVANTNQTVSANNEIVVCFAAGTLIRTVDGDRAIETLAVGDLLVTACGTARPIRWLGHRTIRCASHPTPAAVRPIRIAAHAFGPGRPARDLFVSPGHSVCVDIAGEVLVPASSLVDGMTIAPAANVDAVTYWHVELASHDVILAENLACESYLDMSNRAFFAESDVVALAGAPDVTAVTMTHGDFCRPYVAEGPLVEAMRSRLAARSKSMIVAMGRSGAAASIS